MRPPGWYDDPLHRAFKRYWDGTAWTSTVADAAVGLGPEGGDPIVTPDLAADGSFTGPSPVGSQYPVHGRFQGGSGPGGTFTMEWTVRYGAGTCTTDLVGQWTSS
ncbi:MAG: DUF2510 domain-containing protein [Actinomycetota bacterium]